MKIYYDAEVDALYIELRSLAAGTAENRELSEDITANYGPDGKLAGLEILDASSVLGDNFSKVVVELSPIVGTPKDESLVSK
ncbi:MAG: DUF2283 domain-containing protein [Microcoleaceae cyanobacterium]|jgi:uncharacterized protein YuzE